MGRRRRWRFAGGGRRRRKKMALAGRAAYETRISGFSCARDCAANIQEENAVAQRCRFYRKAKVRAALRGNAGREVEVYTGKPPSRDREGRVPAVTYAPAQPLRQKPAGNVYKPYIQPRQGETLPGPCRQCHAQMMPQCRALLPP